MPRACSVCSAVVPRKDCHKNRFGEYICRTCHDSGRTYTPGRRFRYRSKRMFSRLLLGFASVGVATLLLWALYVIFWEFNFLSVLPAKRG